MLAKDCALAAASERTRAKFESINLIAAADSLTFAPVAILVASADASFSCAYAND